MLSIALSDLREFLLDEIIYSRLERGGVDNFDPIGGIECPGAQAPEEYEPSEGPSVEIGAGRLRELMLAHERMEALSNAKVSNCWDGYGWAIEADPKADNVLDRLDLSDVEDMLDAAAEAGTLDPDWYPEEPAASPPVAVALPPVLTFDPPAPKAPDLVGPPGLEEGETCRRDGCDGEMVRQRCGCGDPGAHPPCSNCTDGPKCNSCDGTRDGDPQPVRTVPPKGAWWIVLCPDRGIVTVNGYGRFFREREAAVHAAERYALDTRKMCFVAAADCVVIPPKQSCTIRRIS